MSKSQNGAFIRKIVRHISNGEHESALKDANELLKSLGESHADTVQILMYRGLALQHLNRGEEAEQIDPTSDLVIKGLLRLYKKSQNWERMGDVLERSVQAAYESGAGQHCANVLQELLILRQQHGPEDKLFSALSLLRPSSPLVSLLQAVPLPASVYLPIQAPLYPTQPSSTPSQLPTQIPHVLHLLGSLPLLLHLLLHAESSLASTIADRVRENSLRISSGLSSSDIEAAVLSSQLGMRVIELLRDVANHPSSEDELRRHVEMQEFVHWRRLTAVLGAQTDGTSGAKSKSMSKQSSQSVFDWPSTEPISREQCRVRADSIAGGFVLLQAGGITEDAWIWYLESRDDFAIDGDRELLQNYVRLFPQSNVSLFLIEYCHWSGSPLTIKANSPRSQNMPVLTEKDANRESRGRRRKPRRVPPMVQADAEDIEQEERDDTLANIQLGEQMDTLITAQRALAHVCNAEELWDTAIASADRALRLLSQLEASRGEKLARVHASLNASLGVALTYNFAPKNHLEAARLLERSIKVQPSLPALLALSHIRQAAGLWQLAREDLCAIRALDITDDERLTIDEELGWCLVHMGQLEEGRDALEMAITTKLQAFREADTEKDKVAIARGWWRLGQAELRFTTGDGLKNAEEWFAASARAYPSFAPAYSALGLCLEMRSPSDHGRALKCYQKAFELDATETEAAHKLADGYARDDQWAIVRQIATRVMAGEGGVSGERLRSTPDPDSQRAPLNGWAWQALGATELFYGKYAKAADAFQIALRSLSLDASIWLQLGRAYAGHGRYSAALKALERASELDPASWQAPYHLAEVLTRSGRADEATDKLNEAIAAAKGSDAEMGVLAMLVDTMVANAGHLRSRGCHQQARRLLFGALDTIVHVFCPDTLIHFPIWVWKMIGDITLAIGTMDEAAAQTAKPPPQLLSVLDVLRRLEAAPPAAVLSAEVMDLFRVNESSHLSLRLSVAAFLIRATLIKDDRRSHRCALIDVASACHAFVSTMADGAEVVRPVAIKAVRSALEIDPGDEILWNALGVITAGSNTQLAQHAFVASLQCYSKDPTVWRNFAYLCLGLSDTELAEQAFRRSQTLDPDVALTWLGLGLIFSRYGAVEQAVTLIAHSVTLANGLLPEANLALIVGFAKRQRATGLAADAEVLQLSRMLVRAQPRPINIYIYATVCERLQLREEAVSHFRLATRMFESQFEHSESCELEYWYCVALSSLGRSYLATGAYSAAQQAFDDCWDLIATSTAPSALQLQVRLGQAICLTRLPSSKSASPAIDQCVAQLADISSPEEQEAIAVALARLLWNSRSPSNVAIAKSCLLDCTSHDAPSLVAVATLGALAMMTSDIDLVEATSSELDVARQNSNDHKFADIVLCVRALREDRPQDALGFLEPVTTSSQLQNDLSRLMLSRMLRAVEEDAGVSAMLGGSFFQLAIHDAEKGRLQAMTHQARDRLPGGRLVERASMVAPWDVKSLWAIDREHKQPM